MVEGVVGDAALGVAGIVAAEAVATAAAGQGMKEIHTFGEFAEAPIEQSMLAEPDLQSTLLKVGHHGSITSTRPEFLARVAPQWAVISCGLRNRYGHPREEVLEELQDAGVQTFSTDIDGASCFVLDGKSARADLTCGWRRIR